MELVGTLRIDRSVQKKIVNSHNRNLIRLHNYSLLIMICSYMLDEGRVERDWERKES